LKIDKTIAPYIQNVRYYYGFIDEEEIEGQVTMNFITGDLEYFGRWLIMFADAVEVIAPARLEEILCAYVRSIKKRY